MSGLFLCHCVKSDAGFDYCHSADAAGNGYVHGIVEGIVTDQLYVVGDVGPADVFEYQVIYSGNGEVDQIHLSVNQYIKIFNHFKDDDVAGSNERVHAVATHVNGTIALR